jgi:hypothetical protein
MVDTCQSPRDGLARLVPVEQSRSVVVLLVGLCLLNISKLFDERANQPCEFQGAV